ncbi:hypothetical protein GCM10009619_39680 [Williamsia maris]
MEPVAAGVSIGSAESDPVSPSSEPHAATTATMHTAADIAAYRFAFNRTLRPLLVYVRAPKARDA